MKRKITYRFYIETIPAASEHEKTQNIYGILGFIKLCTGIILKRKRLSNWTHSIFKKGDYMLTITKREQIGSIRGKAIYRVGAFQILPLASGLAGLNENQVNYSLAWTRGERKLIIYIRKFRNRIL